MNELARMKAALPTAERLRDIATGLSFWAKADADVLRAFADALEKLP